MNDKFVKVTELEELKKLTFQELKPDTRYLVTYPDGLPDKTVAGIGHIAKVFGLEIVLAPESLHFYELQQDHQTQYDYLPGSVDPAPPGYSGHIHFNFRALAEWIQFLANRVSYLEQELSRRANGNDAGI